jgi:uncharacterized protein YvpB
VIAVKPRSEHPVAVAARAPARGARWSSRLPAVFLAAAIVVSLGGGGLLDVGSAYTLQGRAQSLQARWAYMLESGIPSSDLAELRHEWTQAQASKLLGVSSMFWLPGGVETVARWESATEAVWVSDLSRYRADAFASERLLRNALAPEPHVQRKARLDALAEATTPLDFATLRQEWTVEARLVPIDRRIAASVAAISTDTAQARSLGIRSDPAADAVARAGAYAELAPVERMARAEMLTRNLIATRQDLEGRLAAATLAHQAFQRANDEIALAQLYGLDTSALSAKVASDRDLYAKALTAAQFTSVGSDLKQVAAAADHQVYVAISQTHIVGGVAFIYQDHPLSCEEASTSMALTHQGIHLSQDQILAEIGADLRPMYVDGAGRVRWGNPYETFVGSVNGNESNYTGFGAYWPPLVRVAQRHGARLIAYGRMSAATIYARVIAGHPVVAFATWDWQWHPRRDYLSFDGQWIPWIGPVYASHVYVVVGVSPGRVLVNDPIRGQYWISKASFEAGYSDFGEAIVFA